MNTSILNGITPQKKLQQELFGTELLRDNLEK
jgi:hypothetical protein